MTLKALSDKGIEYNVLCDGDTYVIKKEDIPEGTSYIDVVDSSLFANINQEGYYLICDCNGKGSGLCFFNKKLRISTSNAYYIYAKALIVNFLQY